MSGPAEASQIGGPLKRTSDPSNLHTHPEVSKHRDPPLLQPPSCSQLEEVKTDSLPS